VDLGAAYRFAAEEDFAEPADTGGRFRLWSVDARACGIPGLAEGRVGIPLCAGLSAGAMHGEGTGAVTPRSAEAAWVAARAGAGVEGRLGRFWTLWLQVDGLATLARPTFVIGDVKVCCEGVFGLDAAAGAGFRWP
jgi:hypothetical protein